MSQVSKRAWARIDLNALKKNLGQVRALCANSKIYPVIKSNAYGHGMEQVARALKQSHTRIAGFAVATVAEALELKTIEPELPIVLLNGFVTAQELDECLAKGIEPVVHAKYQVELLEKKFSEDVIGDPRRLWVKHNSGMNRLGLKADACFDAYTNLKKYPDTELLLMSHLAYADDLDNSASRDFTDRQLQEFNSLRQRLRDNCHDQVEASVAASAGILALPETHFHHVRPGVMIYGSSPMANQTGEELGLLPVMTLNSRLISIQDLNAGESVGYGATYTCDKDTRVGVVSIGYGDGYPRSAVNGTPVLVHSQGRAMRTRLIGRVSMDMITIDLSDMPDAQVDDRVVLWGEGLCADEVARSAGTIAYELFCKVTRRVDFEYSQVDQ